MAAETSYPLCWPSRQKRTPAGAREKYAPFSATGVREEQVSNWSNGQRVTRTVTKKFNKPVSVAVAVERLDEQLRFLDARHPVLSTNLEVRLNGVPRSGQQNPPDPGAAIYFTLKGKRIALGCDKWAQVADNIAALAAHIRATRSIEKFGVGTVEQAFTGYQAIENFSDGIPWRRVLGFKDDEPVTLEQVEAKFRELMKQYHPDVAGGDHAQAAQLNLAIAEARAELSQ